MIKRDRVRAGPGKPRQCVGSAREDAGIFAPRSPEVPPAMAHGQLVSRSTAVASIVVPCHQELTFHPQTAAGFYYAVDLRKISRSFAQRGPTPLPCPSPQSIARRWEGDARQMRLYRIYAQ